MGTVLSPYDVTFSNFWRFFSETFCAYVMLLNFYIGCGCAVCVSHHFRLMFANLFYLHVIWKHTFHAIEKAQREQVSLKLVFCGTTSLKFHLSYLFYFNFVIRALKFIYCQVSFKIFSNLNTL